VGRANSSSKAFGISFADRPKAKREDNWGKKKIAIISTYEHTKLKLTVFMLLGGPQNTIKSHLVFTAFRPILRFL
jgi:hypothetical protein